VFFCGGGGGGVGAGVFFFFFDNLLDLCNSSQLVHCACLQTRLADLLGVAGTDVPIKDMERLTYNYKVTCTHYLES